MGNATWSEPRILQMIADGIEENLHLDYKGAGALAKQKRDEIVKDATAFANSDGGVIIYGVREHSAIEKKHLPSHIDPIDRREFSKEWLEQVIGNAAPRILGVVIHPVSIAADPSKCLYVVEIPKGETAHQSADCRYYRRFNFQSVFMADHEIRDVMNRNKVPRIEVEAFLTIRQPWEGKSSFRLTLNNIGSRIAKRFGCRVRLPPILAGVEVIPDEDMLDFRREPGGDYFQISLGQDLRQTPIFPKGGVILKQALKLGRPILKDGSSLAPRRLIEVVVYADEMEPIRAEFAPQLIMDAWGLPLDRVLPEGVVNSAGGE